MNLGIEGKRALITGSNTDIGKGIARSLAAEGVRVIIHGRNQERSHRTAAAINTEGGSAESVAGDLSSAEGAASVIGAVLAKGEIDILANNAGGSDAALSDWFAIADERWERSFSLNFLSAVRTIRAFVPRMRMKGWGRVINISSASATTPTADIADYQASKAALVNLTMSLSRSLAGSGVTANVVSAGPILTPSPRHWLQSLAKARGQTEIDEVALEIARDHYKLDVHRWGKTEEIGAAVALLASKLSDFTSGANFHIDGGQTRGLH